MSDVSIKEVAQLAGVSIATVSRCINNPEKVTEKTRLKVQDAIVQTGYAPNTLAQSFRRGRTTLIIAHRFSTLRKADRIVVVEDGQIVGQGSHDSLVASNPTYQRLYRRQWTEGRGDSI